MEKKKNEEAGREGGGRGRGAVRSKRRGRGGYKRGREGGGRGVLSYQAVFIRSLH